MAVDMIQLQTSFMWPQSLCFRSDLGDLEPRWRGWAYTVQFPQSPLVISNPTTSDGHESRNGVCNASESHTGRISQP